MIPSRENIEASIMQIDTQELFEHIETLKIDMIALITPDADFIEEVEKCLLWLSGKGERTSQNLQLIPARSSAVHNGKIFPTNGETSWQSYVWSDYLFLQCVSQQPGRTRKCIQVVNNSGEVFNVKLSLDDGGCQIVSIYDAKYCAPQYRSIWLAPEGHLIGRYYADEFLSDNSSMAGLQMKEYIDPDYNHPTGQYYSFTLDSHFSGYTYQGSWQLDADNILTICTWLHDSIDRGV